MFPRRFLNLVSRKWGLDDMYSLHRLDAAKYLFYPSVQEATAAADDEKIKNTRLPKPTMSFDTSALSLGLEWFDLFAPRGGQGRRIVLSNTAGDTSMFDADLPQAKGMDPASLFTLPGLSQPKGMDPVSLSVSHPGGDGEDSLYVMHRFPGQAVTQARPSSCFEVLECRIDDMDKRWQWRLLPPPPFVHHQPSSYITSYTTITGAADGCTTICVSSSDPDKKNGGTYCFDTARLDPTLETWRQVGDWEMPFEGRAEHVPELGVWLGFTAGSKLHHLCAVSDLSATMDGPCSEAPTPQHVWEDATLPGEEDWRPQLLRVIGMGDNKFCVAKIFHDNKVVGDQFAVLTGVEMERGGQEGHGLRMVRHKRTRHVFKGHSVKWVL
ncbi:unnamed protein product [Alopecurus aequalis]